MARRRRRFALVLLIALIAVPVVEIYVLIQVGQVIGPWWTVGLLLLASVVGSWLIKREGARAWRALRSAVDEGRMPAREIADGVLIVLGGALMLSPGFVTDAVGVLLILPLTRPLLRRILTGVLERRMVVVPGGSDATRPGAGPQGPIIRGEVVDDGM
ncbi:FxsA family protein [Nocardioides sp. R-C-SC26]|uniref:FxsA family protein n=1 Tax=Nocardioides sp. R-C-SC26 TaxID=2870414 RepID=UPI001E42F26E|nr:FxsA family protein [Nocardioides sp. R-C-SC26]